MRVDLGASASASVNAIDLSASAAVSTGRGNAGIPEDTASLLSGSSSVDALVQQALAPSEVRQAHVEALRSAVSGSTYTVDPAMIAAAVVSEWV